MACTTSSLSGLTGPFAHPLWKMDVAAAELLQWSEMTILSRLKPVTISKLLQCLSPLTYIYNSMLMSKKNPNFSSEESK